MIEVYLIISGLSSLTRYIWCDGYEVQVSQFIQTWKIHSILVYMQLPVRLVFPVLRGNTQNIFAWCKYMWIDDQRCLLHKYYAVYYTKKTFVACIQDRLTLFKLCNIETCSQFGIIFVTKIVNMQGIYSCNITLNSFARVLGFLVLLNF